MSYRLVSSSDLMTVDFSGTLTREELFAALQEMEDEERRQIRAPDRLFLLLDVLEWHITAADIQQHAERRRETRLPNSIKSAIVAQRHSHAAVARIFALYLARFWTAVATKFRFRRQHSIAFRATARTL